MTTSPFELVNRPAARPLLVIGAALDSSGSGRGEVRAAARLREAGLVERLGARDFGDLDVSVEDPERDPRSGVIGLRDLVSASRTIRDAVASALVAGWRPLVLGGCCSVVPGTLAGVRRTLGPASLVVVDGHLDLFDGTTSRTGEMGRMDLAIVLGHGPPELTSLDGDPPLAEASDVVAVGDGDHPRRVTLRAPGPAEIAPDLRVIDCGEVTQRGARQVGVHVAELAGGGSAPFWLHLDVDVVDGEAMPAVSSPVATGLSWDQVAELLAPALRSPRLIGMTVCGYNPDLDAGGEFAYCIVDLLADGLLRSR
ncbi:arginase family protein [Conexibacter woesei]|uniref:Arginase/agmatinase/formiminoglutamase n=1 Tax=Conexibacter woesei (strain DSM 14684 / CCUG 47730 / CIP 108061 / JCM 11494 / NBRC 100937 / ID131577) TaxID=469383 RepID=D3F9C2_CONWI|nr:arginase family protein [Conexibacter woesei]ADB49089.1 Arginase/agmatinase/formiminoglutamase [Conexibacter woesei DSM 14684]